MGPVQLLVVGFDGGEFKGEILAELDRLKENDNVRLIDLVLVRKDADGNMEKLLRSDLSPEEAESFGAVVGALVGFGAADEEGAELGHTPRTVTSSTRRSGTSTTRSRTEPLPRWHCSSTAGRSRCAKASATRAASTSRTPGFTPPTWSASGSSRPRRPSCASKRRNVQRSVNRREAPCSSAPRSGMSSSCC